MTAVEASGEERDGGDVIRLADRLKAQREERGISQSQAARELEVARTAYRLWEMEAARPAPDRWRLVARWLGVSMTTLLLAEGLISEDEQFASDRAADRFSAATGLDVDAEATAQTGDFFAQAQSLIDRSIEEGVVSASEAGTMREMFDRIKEHARRPRPGAPGPL
jgi:transcriptional regulator with XRE-family HTH domain